MRAMTLVQFVLLSIAASTAGAQAGPPPGWAADVGVGAIVNPEFAGSEDYQIRPIPYVDARYRDEKGTRLFASVPRGLGGYVYRSSGNPQRRTAVGLAIAPGFATRDDEIDGLDSIDIATEARAYLEFARGFWSASATFAADLGTGHEGAYVDLSLQGRGRIGRRGFWSLGPSLRIVDSDYAEAQYGVSVPESGRSGLAAHDAEQGIEQLSLGGVLSLPITEKWSWTTVASVGRLLGDRADSPIVEQKTQAFLLLAFTRPL